MKSKVVVITGASSGIGMETAKILGECGYRIVLAARREDNLKELKHKIVKKGGKAIYVVTDVSKYNQVEYLANEAVKHFGRIDVWINNAAIMPQSFLKKNHVRDWDDTIDINIKGTLYGIGVALKVMGQQNSGHIINISSVVGHFAHAGQGVYSASKWAVRALSESLREEVAIDHMNIRVSVISPGAINTELLNRIVDKKIHTNLEEFYKNYGISADRVALTIKQTIELPEDAAWNEVIIRPTNQVI